MSGNRQRNGNPLRAARRRLAEWLGGILLAAVAVACGATVTPASGADEPLPDQASGATASDNSATTADKPTEASGAPTPVPANAKPAVTPDTTPATTSASPASPDSDAPTTSDKAASRGGVPAAAPSDASSSTNGNEADKTSAPRPLSVRPETERPYPKIDYAARPRWVEAVSAPVGTVHVVSVSSGPWESPATAMSRLDEELKQAVDKYAVELIEDPKAAQRVSLSAREIRQRLTAEDIYAEVIEVEVGRMHQVHARLQFDDNFRDLIRQRWRQAVTFGRLGIFGTGFLVLLTTLAAAFGYFKVDTATRGDYSRRLQLLTGVAILGSVTVGVVLARHFFWL